MDFDHMYEDGEVGKKMARAEEGLAWQHSPLIWDTTAAIYERGFYEGKGTFFRYGLFWFTTSA
jgi:hypothetical protein